MPKRHLKRYNKPKTWNVAIKKHVFITRSNPGPHCKKTSIPLNVVLRDMLHYSNTTRESKKILTRRNVLVDGIRRKDHKFPVGLFDVIDFKDLQKSYRIVINTKGKIALIEISNDEANIKPCSIRNKTLVKGKIQLNLNDGKNIIVDKKDYKTGDTLILEFPKWSVKKHLGMKKNVFVYLLGGKHTGEMGKVKEINGNKITYVRDKGENVETLKKYAFVIGEDKPLITIAQKN